ncbi:carboxymuconolactone decarboxylase family protein [Sphingomonas sp. PR090111-T3T-6A]|uniref:carboxymuconolactone decarboxylase family protein n=1 Tax=Sphingomonas sp. PR090111-T3T-6A TaxID=685778 RepID=UPI00035F22CB|nr:carboxymuconolactone decarboxylase family protein [Sphingomonas sp. PR090111-T3T-6A]
MTLTPRQNIFQTASAGVKAMMAVEGAIASSGVDHSLLHLVKLRASQINGCSFCIHMHAKEAVKQGESDMRIHLLNAWRESPLFNDRERAALAWTETLTTVSETGAPDALYEELQRHFNETEIAYLTFQIGAINLWNRLQIGLRAIHGVDATDKPAAQAA